MSLECSNTETYIFMLKGDMFKAILDFNKKTFTVHTNLEVVVLKIEHVSIMRMKDIRQKLRDYIKDGKKLKGFPPPGARFL